MAFDEPFVGLKGIQGAFGKFWNIVAQGRQRNLGLFSRVVRGVWRPRESLEILSFLSQTC
jgi:hypothetical protein